MTHSFKEPRLLWKQGDAEQSNQDLLQAVTAEDNLSPREKLERKFTEDKDSAANRIKATGRKWTDFLSSRGSLEGANQSAVDADITKIAQERAKVASTNITGYASGAERKLFDRSANATNSLVILENKQRVCDEVIKDLREEIDAKKEMRARYEAALGELGKLKGKHSDAPALKKIELKLSLVEGVRENNEKKIAERMADENIARTGRIHDNLKSFLLNAQPGLATSIDRMLLDNAAGENDNLLKAIESLSSVDKAERAMLKDLAKHLKLGSFTWANNRSIRELYQSKSTANATLNSPKLKDRLESLYDKAAIGQGVVIMMDGTRLNLGVIRKDSNRGRKVVLVNAQGQQTAVIDITRKIFTIRTSPTEFTHGELKDIVLNPKDNDPTKMQFHAKKTEVTLAA